MGRVVKNLSACLGAAAIMRGFRARDQVSLATSIACLHCEHTSFLLGKQGRGDVEWLGGQRLEAVDVREATSNSPCISDVRG
jgi:hypothetical protein